MNQQVFRLTALWAFAECGLGGFMHALHLPFSGVFVGGISVTVATILGWLTPRDDRFRVIMQTLTIVLVIKLGVSPHSPPPAYFAVAFQGIFSAIIYRWVGVNAASITTVFVVTALESTFQKFLVWTLFFGRSLWEAIDAYGAAVVKKMSWLFGVTASEALITIYVAIYVVGAIWFSWQNVLLKREWEDGTMKPLASQPINNLTPKKKKKKWKRWAFIGVLGLAVFFMNPGETDASKAIYVVVRAVLVILVWFYVVVPLFAKLLQRILAKSKKKWSKTAQETIAFFPELKGMTATSWQLAKTKPRWRRLGVFLRGLVGGLLAVDGVERDSLDGG